MAVMKADGGREPGGIEGKEGRYKCTCTYHVYSLLLRAQNSNCPGITGLSDPIMN